MRFIAKYALHGVQIRPVIQEAYATGMAKVIQEPLYAYFKPGGLTEKERELAIQQFTFNGFYQLEDEVTIMPPDYRLGLYDSIVHQITDGFSDEVRKEIEQELVANSALTGNLIVVPEDIIPPPWPNYDFYEGTPAELVRKLVEEGHDLAAVLAYERAHQDRALVVEGLDELIRHSAVEETEEVLG
jgi:hypothetical protein